MNKRATFLTLAAMMAVSTDTYPFTHRVVSDSKKKKPLKRRAHPTQSNLTLPKPKKKRKK